MRQLRAGLGLAFLAAVYFGAAQIGPRLAFLSASDTAFWPPAGIALAALLGLGYRFWPGVLLGAFLVNFTTTGHAMTSLAIALGNTLEALLGAFLVNRWASGARAFERAGDVFKFTFLAGVLSAALGASIGVGSLILGGLAPPVGYAPLWLNWWRGDFVADLIVVPLLLLSPRSRVRWDGGKILEAILLVVSLALLAEAVFGELLSPQHYPLEFLCLAPLIWAAFRFGPREAASAAFLLSALAIRATLGGSGPFWVETRNASLLLLQAYMCAAMLVALVLAALVSGRERVEEELRSAHDDLEVLVEERTAALEFEVTERARVGDALKASEARTQAIIDNMLEGLITIDERSIIESVNAATERIFGYGRGELVGQHLKILAPSSVGADPRQLFHEAHRRALGSLTDWTGRRKGGEEFPLEVGLYEFQTPEGPRFGGNVRDVTERQEAERLKDELVFVVAHDFRAPLTVIQGYSELLMARDTDAETRSMVKTIDSNARRLAALAADILTLSGIEGRKFPMKRTPTNITELVRSVVATRFVERGIEITLHAEDEVEADVDPDRLCQVLENLLGNAIKYSPEGGRVRVDVRKAEDGVEVRVADRGPGILPEETPKLFQKFSRLNSALKIPGTGLGLYICRRIIEAHSGRIWAETEPAGSTFCFWLPGSRGA
jgi:PAS domain S-box-containing protein